MSDSGVYQFQRAQEKIHQEKLRCNLLAEKAEDITPKNGDKFIWSKAKDTQEFEKKYNMKVVEVEGIFDFELEKHIIKY